MNGESSKVLFNNSWKQGEGRGEGSSSLGFKMFTGTKILILAQNQLL